MSKKILSKNAFIVIAGLALIAGCGQQAPPQVAAAGLALLAGGRQQAPPQTANIRDAAEALVQEGESNASGDATQTPGPETDAAKGQTDTVKKLAQQMTRG